MIPRASFIFSCLIVLLSSLWTPARAQQTGPAEVVRQNGRTYLRIGGGELPPDRLIVKVHPGRSAAFQHATPGARQLGRNPDLFLVQVPLSKWWLARHELGPMEWLWRRLTYGRVSVPAPESALAITRK